MPEAKIYNLWKLFGCGILLQNENKLLSQAIVGKNSEEGFKSVKQWRLHIRLGNTEQKKALGEFARATCFRKKLNFNSFKQEQFYKTK